MQESTLANQQSVLPPWRAADWIARLLEKFRQARALKEVVFAQLVAGANAAFAYVRLHRSHVPLEVILGELPRESDYEESYAPARRAIHQILHRTEEIVGPLDAPKEESVD